MSEGKADASASALLKQDEELAKNAAKFQQLAKEFNTAASSEIVATTTKALEAKGFVVKHAKDAADALAYITGIPKDGQSMCSGGSTTLDEIGFTEWAKKQTKLKDYKALSLARMAQGDMAGTLALRKEGALADVFFASAAAVTQEGEVLWGSGTGTRVSILAGQLVFVIGTNKIVANSAKARERLQEWQLPLESARMRLLYKAKGSAVNETGNVDVVQHVTGTVSGVSPYAPKSMHVVFVPGVYGF